MKMQTQIFVVGMKASKGQLENGTPFDSTKLFCLTDMDDRRGKAKGQAVAEYNIGLSDEFDKFANVNFPFRANVDMEIVTNGKTSQVLISNIQPVTVAAKAS